MLIRLANAQIDEMGDKVGRVYLNPQDLGKLQSRKFKGLKRKPGENGAAAEAEASAAGDGETTTEVAAADEGRKRRKEA